jgi:hypothetical protein
MLMRIPHLISSAIVVAALAGCQSDPAASSDSGTSAPTISSSPSRSPSPSVSPTGPQLTFVALGDSWPNGAHCGGCRTFMGLYADRLTRAGKRVIFVDLTQAAVPSTGEGQTPASLLADLQRSAPVRQRIATADIIVVHTGLNDLEGPELGAHMSSQCGGSDNADCMRRLGARWQKTFEGMLREIRTLRAGRATAIRLVTAENNFLTDPAFGAEFGRSTGKVVVEQLARAMCAAASSGGAKCVDIRVLLNGPSVDRPADENAPETHQAVADALFRSGLAELE